MNAELLVIPPRFVTKTVIVVVTPTCLSPVNEISDGPVTKSDNCIPGGGSVFTTRLSVVIPDVPVEEVGLPVQVNVKERDPVLKFAVVYCPEGIVLPPAQLPDALHAPTFTVVHFRYAGLLFSVTMEPSVEKDCPPAEPLRST